jgi:hypothetical protein
LGTFGQFIYDLMGIWYLRKSKPDVVLQMGYTSSGVWQWLIPARVPVATNMDGLEWRRTKYSKMVQLFLKWSERRVIRRAEQIIGDNPAICEYIDKKYDRGSSIFIPYGSAVIETQDDESILSDLQLKKDEYFLIIARIEPENHIREILLGIRQSDLNKKAVIVGNENAYAAKLKKEFRGHEYLFLHNLYDKNVLNVLRKNCLRYFHGHSVGGTNPSLLEAMAQKCLIYAHDNPFNKAVLHDNARYFSSSRDISNLLNHRLPPSDLAIWKKANLDAVLTKYDWDSVTDQYELVLEQAVRMKT